MSTIENDATDLQTSLQSLDAEKQDSLSNANVVEGQPIKIGSILNNIGAKDNTLTGETSDGIVKLGVDKAIMQEKLTTITDNDGARALLVDKRVKGLAADDTVNIISWASDTLQVSVNKQKIQEQLTSGLTGTLTNAASILSDAKIRGVKGVDIGVSVENDLVCVDGSANFKMVRADWS